MPSKLAELYASEKYNEVDPFASVSLKCSVSTIYPFEKRGLLFEGRCSRVEDMLSALHEYRFSNSVLFPALPGESNVTGLNIWSELSEKELGREIAKNFQVLNVAGAIAGLFMRKFISDSLSENFDQRWLKNSHSPNPLSGREIELLTWLAAGLRNDAIAFKMGISVVTVNFHVLSARRKLNADTREQALAIAIMRGLIRP